MDGKWCSVKLQKEGTKMIDLMSRYIGKPLSPEDQEEFERRANSVDDNERIRR